MEDEGEIYESIEDIWPDYPSKEDFFFQRRRILEREHSGQNKKFCPFFVLIFLLWKGGIGKRNVTFLRD